MNIGLLMMLLFLVYGCIGVNIYAEIPPREQINEYDNFKNFPNAVMMLFRFITLDNWSYVMDELLFHDCRNVNEIMDDFNITEPMRSYYYNLYTKKDKANRLSKFNVNRNIAFDEKNFQIPLTPYIDNNNIDIVNNKKNSNFNKKRKHIFKYKQNKNKTNRYRLLQIPTATAIPNKINITEMEKNFEEYMEHIGYNYFCQSYNITCTFKSTDNYTNLINGEEFSCGSEFTYLYFFSFIILGPIFVMNLCVVIVVEGFSESMFEDKSLISTDDLNKFVKEWSYYDPEFTKYLKPYEVVMIFKKLGPPIGLNYDRYFCLNGVENGSINHMKKQIKKRYKNYLLKEKEINIHNDNRNNNIYFNNNDNNNFDINKDIMRLINEEKIDKDFLQFIKINNSGIKRLNNNCFNYKNYYFSPESNNYTKNSEILKIINFFEFKLTENLKEMNIKDKIDNDIYHGMNINFVDCCLLLSKYLTTKKYVSTSNNIRDGLIKSLTRKKWYKAFKFNDEVRKNHKSYNNLLAEKMSLRLIDKFRSNIKAVLNNARNRIEEKKKLLAKKDNDENDYVCE
jgi:hypothetical protein